MVHALRSRRVVTPACEVDAVVLIEGERIAAVLPPGEVPIGCPVEDLGHLALLPGLVDAHTHINEPGRTEWEGFATGTQAAAAGGFTTIVDMPLNCLPETTSVEALEIKRSAASQQCWVDYAFWGGAVNGNAGALGPLAQAGVAGFKCFLLYPGCDGLAEIDLPHLQQAVPHLAGTGLPLLVHAELAAPIERATAELNQRGADWRRYSTYLASRPDAAELEAILMLLQLCREHPFRLHIVHLSSAEALPMLRQARQEGLPVSVETCPHYLHKAAEDIEEGATLWKCAPPLRSRANQDLLWQALEEGTIDLIATDHSPCPPAMKHARFDQAWGGIPSLSMALPVVWTECRKRGLPLTRIADWMAAAPARLVGLSGELGSIAPGQLANFVAFDADQSLEVHEELLFQRHKISPYLGETLYGLVSATWLRGRRIVSAGRFEGVPSGREHARPQHREAAPVRG